MIKQDGESSLMQLKEEFRNYDSLRYEHDLQIAQIATEAGLRISADHWSSLLYGDLMHRAHMQSIVDRIDCSQLLKNAINEFRNILTNRDNHGNLREILNYLSHLNMEKQPKGNFFNVF